MKMSDLCALFLQFQHSVDLQRCIRISAPDKNISLELPLEAVLLWGLKDFFLQDIQGETILRVLSSQESQASYRKGDNLIRLIDCLDNNYLVHDSSRKKYCLFNAVDNLCFKEYEFLLLFLKQNDETIESGYQ